MELISRDALVSFLQFRGDGKRPITYADLADAATRELRLAGIRDRKVSKSTIGHLVTGHIKGTNPDAAKAICKALGVPVGALFVARVSTVQRDVPPTAKRVA